jgi:hypothetical protein
MAAALSTSSPLTTEFLQIDTVRSSGSEAPKERTDPILRNEDDTVGSIAESVEFSLLDKIVFKLDFFFPKSFSRLDVAASLVRNAVHHRTTKQYYSLDDRRRFRAFRLVNSQGFRKTAIVCAFLLAILPTIEIPVSIASPCWLSFVLELFCYSVFTLRLYLEHLCFKSTWMRNPWFCSLNLSIALCWIDVIVTMILVSSSGGNWLSFNNCGMPEPNRNARSASWIYVIGRLSRYVRPVIFMEWNIRTRYLFRSMVRIVSELLNILSILGVLIFVFAAFGYFVWSDPDLYISALPKRFSYFRSIIQSVISMATLTTTENYPDCAIDYMSISFVNVFVFIAFAVLSVFFALNVVLSTVYSTYQEHLKSYYHRRRLKDSNGLARAFQYLCSSENTMSRQRFQTFMRVYDGLSHLDPSDPKNKRRLKVSAVRADFMYSMLCARLRIVAKDVNADVKAYYANQLSEADLMQGLLPVLDAPLSFHEFIHLVPLIRYNFYIRDGSGSSFAKKQILQQLSFADVIRRAVCPEDCHAAPFSPHSTSYLVSRLDPAFSVHHAMVDVDQLLSTTANLESSRGELQKSLNALLLGDVDASRDKDGAIAPTSRSNIANTNLLSTVGLNLSLAGLLPQKKKAPRFTNIVNHRWWSVLRRALIFIGFGLCVLQVEIEQSDRQCQRTLVGAQEELWTGCNSWSYAPGAQPRNLELGFNVGHLTISIILFFDLVSEIWQKGALFFVRSFGNIFWLNIIDGALQIIIFIADIYHIFVFEETVTSSVYIAISLLRLLRVYKVLSLNNTVTAIVTLFRNLYPIVKSFSLIAYTFFFIFSIFGISLFSYASSEHGIAIYPTKSQYVQYFSPRAPSDYPNSNNPGNFACNATDALGLQGVCGQAGPQSPLPFWSTVDTSAAGVAALDAAFVIGDGIDARVGGCFNLIADANNRVLPCYCYYTAAKMNRTTSCDWLNPRWYHTDVGQVRACKKKMALVRQP